MQIKSYLTALVCLGFSTFVATADDSESKDSPVQSAARPYNLDIVAPVQIAGSDAAAKMFQAEVLPGMLETMKSTLPGRPIRRARACRPMSPQASATSCCGSWMRQTKAACGCLRTKSRIHSKCNPVISRLCEESLRNIHARLRNAARTPAIMVSNPIDGPGRSTTCSGKEGTCMKPTRIGKAFTAT